MLSPSGAGTTCSWWLAGCSRLKVGSQCLRCCPRFNWTTVASAVLLVCVCVLPRFCQLLFQRRGGSLAVRVRSCWRVVLLCRLFSSQDIAVRLQ